MPTFDVVSEVDVVDVKHAVENASRELNNRFDFRNVEASFDLKELVVTIKAEGGDFQLQQMEDMLRAAMVKRNVDPKAIKIDEKDIHRGKSFSRIVRFQQGLDTLLSKKIVKLIKEKKLKVQASIQGEKVRVTGKKRDDLQSVIAMLRAEELEQALQFDNFRD
ncbi:YajQ family cyclic di-GMP-binding protein [Corallincola luteus]|uniref:Nucleotide-binding protein DU002_02075 n=2 Tax=Corallincola TaxID=1775176 RepID=A0A368NU80_9GAMM|nr:MULTISPECIES: YajQ family cyclic di-GMP-binding protein [Corallincola]RCU52771.1 YajQ family cyclic di-GMP-binding protein [Corallincola holothuriorum]TCI03272.1 YajQ family cyclic di-GMP-binding protein [Corallincola luteus]